MNPMDERLTTRLNSFSGREEALSAIKRFWIFSPMYYRSNVFEHSLRVSWIVQEITPLAREVFGSGFDEDRAVLTACIHDDHEIVIGDVQGSQKHAMTTSQKSEFRTTEELAIIKVASRFPEYIGQYRYQDLLTDALEMKSVEAQIAMFADKVDGFGESLHEIYAGNETFVHHLTDPTFGVIVTPIEYYIPILSSFVSKHTELVSLFRKSFPLFSSPDIIDFTKIARTHHPHTPATLDAPTGYLHYDEWKRIILKYGGEAARRELLTQREFPHKKTPDVRR